MSDRSAAVPDVKTANDVPIDRPCIHCGLPTPAHENTAAEDVFCCSGCRAAYQLIHGWGLSEFYALRDQMAQTESGLAAGRRTGFEAFDSDQFLGESSPQRTADGLMSAELALHGLHCGACAWLIENAARRTDGWKVARVRMSDHTIRILYDPDKLRLSQVARLLDQLGYGLAPLTKQPDEQYRREHRKLVVQIAIAGFCAANAMWIAIALYAGEASGVAVSHWLFLRMMGTALGVAAVVGPGRTFFRGALASLRTRTPHMDLPVALGLFVGTVVGMANAVLGSGAVYFDSLAILVFLLLIGRWIQFHQQHRAARAVELLLRITPRHAQRITPAGDTELVLVDTLCAGDLVRVAAGDAVPVDGTITAGESTIDRSLLTGESRTVSAAVGDLVAAGTMNVSRPIDVSVQAVGDDSRIGKVMQSVEAAAADKTGLVQLADRIGGVFVVVVMILAVAVFLVWCRDGWRFAAENATSLLIVACPCALALATPLAIAISLGRAARRKILIRDGDALQYLSGSGTIWFDKTGTLTEGRPRVVELFGDETAIGHAAGVERDVCHPLADGIIAACQQRGLSISHDAQLGSVLAGGIRGRSAGRAVDIGNLNFLRSRGVDVSAVMAQAAEAFASRGESPVLIAIDGAAVTVLGITDPLRGSVVETMRRIRNAGWNVGILSGDHRDIVTSVGRKIGLPADRALGGLSPEEKLEIVHGTHGAGESVVMVGDGANDAAALAAADVGIAVRGGAEVSMQAAPVYVASGKVSSIADLIDAAKSAHRLIRTTFAVSLTYNLIAVALAATGQINPLVAAVLMPISSISVLTITLAWPTFRKLEA